MKKSNIVLPNIGTLNMISTESEVLDKYCQRQFGLSCSDCNLIFSHESDLHTHIRSSHNNAPVLEIRTSRQNSTRSSEGEFNPRNADGSFSSSATRSHIGTPTKLSCSEDLNLNKMSITSLCNDEDEDPLSAALRLSTQAQTPTTRSPRSYALSIAQAQNVHAFRRNHAPPPVLTGPVRYRSDGRRYTCESHSPSFPYDKSRPSPPDYNTLYPTERYQRIELRYESDPPPIDLNGGKLIHHTPSPNVIAAHGLVNLSQRSPSSSSPLPGYCEHSPTRSPSAAVDEPKTKQKGCNIAYSVEELHFIQYHIETGRNGGNAEGGWKHDSDIFNEWFKRDKGAACLNSRYYRSRWVPRLSPEGHWLYTASGRLIMKKLNIRPEGSGKNLDAIRFRIYLNFLTRCPRQAIGYSWVKPEHKELAQRILDSRNGLDLPGAIPETQCLNDDRSISERALDLCPTSQEDKINKEELKACRIKLGLSPKATGTSDTDGRPLKEVPFPEDVSGLRMEDIEPCWVEQWSQKDWGLRNSGGVSKKSDTPKQKFKIEEGKRSGRDRSKTDTMKEIKAANSRRTSTTSSTSDYAMHVKHQMDNDVKMIDVDDDIVVVVATYDKPDTSSLARRHLRERKKGGNK